MICLKDKRRGPEKIMKLKDKFIPDYMFDNVLRIKPEFFADNDIRYIVTDIDNTLATYGESVADEKIRDWLGKVEACGVRIALISNNKEDRVYMFNSVLGYLTTSRAGKPGKKKLLKLMKKMGAEPEKTCLIGDQIFTDVLCAHRAGIRALMVRSIEVAGRPFLKFKKYFEHTFIEEYYKRNPVR